MIRWEAAGASDVGRVRQGNEDSFHLDVERGVFIVADGMGGHAAGEVASDLATRAVAESLSRAVDRRLGPGGMEEALDRAVRLAHERIASCCADDPTTRGMGTTLTCCVLQPGGECLVAHIGDSRLYRLRAGHLEALTRDHTWVQQEVDAGRLPAPAAAGHRLSHILTRVLSNDTPADADLLGVRLEPGDLLLLCSDGLYNMISDREIAELLTVGGELTHVLTSLLTAANAAGGTDNITAVAVRVLAA